MASVCELEFVVESVEPFGQENGATVVLGNGKSKVSVLYRPSTVQHVIDTRGEFETWYNMYEDTYDMIDDELLSILKLADSAYNEYTQNFTNKEQVQ